jgi:acetoin utilization protein AcuB
MVSAGRPSIAVSDIMTRAPLSITARTTVGQAWEVLQSLDVRHLPVINEDRELVGIVSDRDFGATPYPSLPMTEMLGPRDVPLDQPVTRIMSSDVISVDQDSDVEEVIDLMLEHKIGAVPVVTPEQHVVGIVSYLDVLRAMTPSGAERV